MAIAARTVTDICRAVDPTSTEEAIKKAHGADVVEGEEHAKVAVATEPVPPQPQPPQAGLTAAEEEEFGAGLGE